MAAMAHLHSLIEALSRSAIGALYSNFCLEATGREADPEAQHHERLTFALKPSVDLSEMELHAGGG
eukprot:760789-Hanusia_phi.AAC.3